jgi:hypothetical protein
MIGTFNQFMPISDAKTGLQLVNQDALFYGENCDKKTKTLEQ